MQFVDLFKYNSLISLPLFLAVSILLIRTAPEYSFKTQTISKSLRFFKDRTTRRVFRINFIAKAILDLGFYFYLLFHEFITWKSMTSLFLISAIIMFGALAYYTEEYNRFVHRFLTYTLGVFWSIVEILLAARTGNTVFIGMTYFLAVPPLVLAFLYLYLDKTNVYVQLAASSLIYIWLLWYVFVFL